MLKRLKRKLRRKGGFSLTELLVAMLILTLLTSFGLLGVSEALQNRNKMIRLSDAQTLGGTAVEAIANELRFGNSIEVTGSDVQLVSSAYSGSAAAISLDGDGKLTVGGKAILQDSLYNGLHLSELTFSESGGAISFAIAVAEDTPIASDGGSIWSATYTVTPLNAASGAGTT